MSSTVDLIPQEQLVIGVDVSRVQLVAGRALEVEEAHEVALLSMDVTEDLNGRLDPQQHRLFLYNVFRLVTQPVDQLG